MVSIIDSHTGFETGRTAADSAVMKNIDLSEMNNKTLPSPEIMTGRNFSVGLDTGMSTARSAMQQTGQNAFKAVHQIDLDTIRSANQTAHPSMTTDPPFLMWNINDVRVGYDNDQAKQFNLDGSDI